MDMTKEEMRRRIDRLEGELKESRAYGVQLLASIGDKLKWEMAGAQSASTWRDKYHAIARELQLAQVGLTSGCGCPIGQCQKMNIQKPKLGEGQCWMLWAEGHLLARMGNMRISELQTNAYHPSRFRAAREEGHVAQPIRDPDKQPLFPTAVANSSGVVLEPGITGECSTETGGEPR